MKKETGVALIELLIVISIIGIIGLTLVSLYTMGIRVFQTEFKNSNLQSENSVILDRIVKDAKEAIGTEDTYDIYTGTTTDTLILKVPAKDIDNNFIYDMNGYFITDRIIYKKASNVMKRIIIADPSSNRKNIENNISDKVTEFSIVYNPGILDARDIQVTLTTQDKTGNETLSVNNTTKVILRNN